MRNAAVSERPPVGVFVGLATLDVIHRIAKPPAANEKITSTAQFVAAGGPAANAAVTFAALGGRAILVTALGADPIAGMIRAELTAHDVAVVDAAAGTIRAVPVSAVAVVESTGDRSVISADAVNSEASAPDELAGLIAGADVVLVDGHHPLMARAAAAHATSHRRTLVVDAGRWKPVMADLIPHATDMVCSADFRTPGTEDQAATAAALIGAGVGTVVITHGGDPVEWWAGGDSGSVAVPPVDVVDTLGAGDVFHGAYAYHAVDPDVGVAERLCRSARVAALRCSVIGPRAWLSKLACEQTRM